MRSRARLVAVERQLKLAARERDDLKRRLDRYEAILGAIGQAAPSAPDDDEVAVIELAAASQQPKTNWMPVNLDVRGQSVLALVCNCGPVDPDSMWQAIRRLTRPLRRAV